MQPPFTHLSSTGQPPLPAEVLEAYQRIFYARVAEGTVKPLVLPYHLFGLIPVVIYLCISHTQRPWLYKARWVVLAVVEWWQIKTMRETSSRSVANGFGAGLVAAWGMVWAATWLVFEKPQWDGKRIRRRRRKSLREEAESIRMLNGQDENKPIKTNGSVVKLHGEGLKHRGTANGHGSPLAANGHTDLNSKASQRAVETLPGDEEWEYYWQPYPSRVSERISWVLELLLSFREPGWNYAIPPLPPLSTSFKTSSGESLYPPQLKSSESSRTILRPFQSRRDLTAYRIPRFIIGYIFLDIIKTIMMHDPYFLFGPTTYALPPHLAALHPQVLTLMRQILGAVGIIISIELIFSIPPVLTLLIPPSWDVPLILTPPYHPSTWGSFSALFTEGLAGLWGTWWHQTFRFGFSAPYDWAVREGFVKPKTLSARLFSLVCAFGISGFLHASGSFTETAETRPLSAPIFFFLQALGIIMQSSFAIYFKSRITQLPSWLRKAGNLLYICVWLHVTGNWLIDDFSRCKIWLYEPVPVSFARGLGYGVGEKAGWGSFWLGKRWEPIDLSWYSGERWWESGIAF